MLKLLFLPLKNFLLLEFHPHIDRLISIPSKMKFRELWSFGGYLKGMDMTSSMISIIHLDQILSPFNQGHMCFSFKSLGGKE